jgi:hypothetical protein
MQLRSGKVVNKHDREMMDAAETLLSLNKTKSHPLYQMCVNQKIKEAPQSLQDSCGTCLRQIVEESVLKGINIKFEMQ